MSRWEPTTQGWVQASPVFCSSSAEEGERGNGGSTTPRIKRFTIMTYNVLFDHYLRDLIRSPKRHQSLFEVIREADCDIVCLQEVQPAFLKELLQEEWVRAQYWTSAEPACGSLSYSGVVVLSRHAFSSLAIHDLPQTCGNTSPCIRVTLPVDGSNDITICSAHLNHSNMQVKTCQLANMLRLTESSQRSILIGDFNVHSLSLEDYVDAWSEAQSKQRSKRWKTLSSTSRDGHNGGVPLEAEDDGAKSGHTISTANPMASLMSERDTREEGSVLSMLLSEHLSERRRRSGSSPPPKDEEAVEVSGRIDCILYRNLGKPRSGRGDRKSRHQAGSGRINLAVVKRSALIGGKEVCRAYLTRRFMRLCRTLRKDYSDLATTHSLLLDPASVAAAEAAKAGVDGSAKDPDSSTKGTEDDDTTEDAGKSSDEASGPAAPPGEVEGAASGVFCVPPYTTPELLDERLRLTIEALTNLPDYLCPSDHYYVKATMSILGT
eukprot:TRINITY_DN795_c1_g1_i2.p1 TRINITY_DN795_c1_g1~~TRINITY_DN795_c1_g1_i2.p1  ORF type:complete len:492 (+),score=112.21 TRINITY_DN795_c1_g1_i2:320-1795(+)